MNNYFIPYSGEKPAALLINGHRVLILSEDPECLESELGLLGADRLQRCETEAALGDQSATLNKLAQSINGGVVIAPDNVKLKDVIRSLEIELPWIQ